MYSHAVTFATPVDVLTAVEGEDLPLGLAFYQWCPNNGCIVGNCDGGDESEVREGGDEGGESEGGKLHCKSFESQLFL